MKERPILFSGPLVQAILAGRKTQTRRLVKLPPVPSGLEPWDLISVDKHPARFIARNPKPDCFSAVEDVACPYGVPGDRLWVREACALVKSPSMGDWRWPEDGEDADAVWYRATDSLHLSHGGNGMGRALDTYALVRPDRWRPSIHMPRWASRITLEITDVRVQRLLDISEEDARAEGAAFHDGRGIGHSGWRHDLKDVHADARSSFWRLWRSINGDGSWAANPWVWALTFKRIDEVRR